MKQTRLWFFLFALSVLVLTACAQEQPEPAPNDEPGSRPDQSTPPPSNTIASPGGTVRPVPALPYTPDRVQPTAPAAGGEAPQELVEQMIDDLAAKLGIERQSITVISTEAITWNDGSLGCPKPGEFYTQALVPGYRVMLEANGKRYNYHASEQGYFFLCTAPLPGGSAPNQ